MYTEWQSCARWKSQTDTKFDRTPKLPEETRRCDYRPRCTVGASGYQDGDPCWEPNDASRCRAAGAWGNYAHGARFSATAGLAGLDQARHCGVPVRALFRSGLRVSEGVRFES